MDVWNSLPLAILAVKSRADFLNMWEFIYDGSITF